MVRKPNINQMLEYLGINLTPEMKKVLTTLKREKSVDENKLAETLKVRVNDIRKLMYELSHRGLVKYTKTKSEDKQWWYIYLWSLDEKAIRETWVGKKMRELQEKQELLKTEKANMFRCDGCGTKFTVEESLDHGYFCPKCGGVLANIMRKTSAAQFERDIKQLEKDISLFK